MEELCFLFQTQDGTGVFSTTGDMLTGETACALKEALVALKSHTHVQHLALALEKCKANVLTPELPWKSSVI